MKRFTFQVIGTALANVTVTDHANDMLEAKDAVRRGEGDGWGEVEFNPNNLDVALVSEEVVDCMTPDERSIIRGWLLDYATLDETQRGYVLTYPQLVSKLWGLVGRDEA